MLHGMAVDCILCETRPADHAALITIYDQAFPDEPLHELVAALLAEPSGVLSLFAYVEDQLAGHAVFTRCTIGDAPTPLSLLGPLAIRPEWQRQGIGSRLIRDGIARLRHEGHVAVLVLGDPDYYGRFGFTAQRAIAPPHAVPKTWRSAWQVLPLDPAAAALAGPLKVLPAWDDPALWRP